MAASAEYEAHLALLTELHTKAFEGVRQLIDLNLTNTYVSLAETNAAVRRLLDDQQVQAWLSPADAERAATACCDLNGIIKRLHTEFRRCAEQRVMEANRDLIALINITIESAPDGAAESVAFLQQTLQDINAGYEQFLQAIENIGPAPTVQNHPSDNGMK